MTNQRYNTTYLQRFTQYILLVSLSGCFTTNVALPIPPEYSPPIASVLPGNTPIVRYAPESTVGHQFVLGLLPIGSITTRLLTSSLARSITAASLSQESAADQRHPAPPQLITISDISLSGWDLLLIRRISCTIEAEVCRTDGGGVRSSCARLRSQASTYHQFAFKPQLQQTLAVCLSRLSKKIIQRPREW